MKSSSDSFVRSVRLTRRTASVTISVPEAAWHLAINGLLRYFPVPTNKRERNARPAIVNTSSIPTIMTADVWEEDLCWYSVSRNP